MEVSFLEGVVEAKTSGGWVQIDTGDTIAIDTVFRVGTNAILELVDDRQTITVSASGTFSLKEVLKDMQVRSSDRGIGRFLSNALTGLLAGKGTGSEIVTMGARAQEAKDTELTWLEAEEETLRKGKAFLREEKYDEALEFFQRASAEAFSDELDHYQLFVGYCYALMGRRALALKTLNSMTPDKSVSFYDDWLRLRGQLCYESMAYRQSLELFEEYISLFPEGDKRQSAHLFSGLCNSELGNEKAARSEFEKAYQMDSKSEIGAIAKSQFK